MLPHCCLKHSVLYTFKGLVYLLMLYCRCPNQDEVRINQIRDIFSLDVDLAEDYIGLLRNGLD